MSELELKILEYLMKKWLYSDMMGAIYNRLDSWEGEMGEDIIGSGAFIYRE